MGRRARNGGVRDESGCRPEAAALSDQERTSLRAAATLTDPEAILEAVIPVLAQRTPARRPPPPPGPPRPAGTSGPLRAARERVRRLQIRLRALGHATRRPQHAPPRLLLSWRKARANLATARVRTRTAAARTAARQQLSLFFKNRRRFFATLAGDTQRPPCPISWQQLNEHHSREAASATTPPLTPAEAAALEADISEQEVVDQVGKAAPHTAPGSDGAGIDALKHLVKDPALLGALVALLRACWQTKSTPARWRASTAVLLLKRGKDPTAVSSWRHVALCDVLAKLYSGILAHRLTDFLGHPGRLAPLSTASRRRSAPYVIRKGLRLAGIPGHLQAAILELYQGSP
ncbi:hypothetical protein PAPYR_8314 [Paratrimastix pyriformis]|uniref:Reverse transcriptase n=1 Tax=Paratrimastix pyriformis TaxID=342808 RepID=A0ABQ8UDG8_9EUKA|nr:hypothetical protein PAPYR_8314 [Paratrimastix pyriformis]